MSNLSSQIIKLDLHSRTFGDYSSKFFSDCLLSDIQPTASKHCFQRISISKAWSTKQ